MHRDRIFVLFLAVLVAVGRFTIPGHGLTGWPGFYEMLAHVYVGVIGTLAVQCWIWTPGEWRHKLREFVFPYGMVLLLLTALEVVAFKIQNG